MIQKKRPKPLEIIEILKNMGATGEINQIDDNFPDDILPYIEKPINMNENHSNKRKQNHHFRPLSIYNLEKLSSIQSNVVYSYLYGDTLFLGLQNGYIHTLIYNPGVCFYFFFTLCVL